LTPRGNLASDGLSLFDGAREGFFTVRWKCSVAAMRTVAAVVLGRLPKIRRRGLVIYCAATLAGLMIFLLGMTAPIAVLAVAAILNGFALGNSELVVDEHHAGARTGDAGRVSSIDSLGSFALLPVGFALAGWAADQISAPNVCIIGGGVTALVVAIMGSCTGPYPRVFGR
jgi:hypothetical protein